MTRKGDGPRELKYKIHNSIDALSRVIIDTKVTSGKIHEAQVYIERLNYIRQKHSITIQEVIADRGYGSREIIESLQNQSTITYIPLFSTRSGKRIQEVNKSGFIYEKEHDHFVCPAGRHLYPEGSVNNESKRYRTKASDCIKCVQKDNCIASATGKYKSIRYLNRNTHQALFNKTLEAYTAASIHQ